MTEEFLARKAAIASLAWNDFINGTTFIEQSAEAKQRGRPRKQEEPIRPAGVTRHRLEDDIAIKSIDAMTQRKMVDDYVELMQEGHSRRDSIERVATLYEVSYAQAYLFTQRSI